jgi:hypothetical protein
LRRRSRFWDKTEVSILKITMSRIAGKVASKYTDSSVYLLYRCYTHPLTSASVRGRSSFRYSRLAASNRCFIITGSSASAAINAALSAILRMLPPAILSLASRSGINPSVGVWVGNTYRQISARCLASGNGNCTTKRRRRRKT